MYKYHCQRKEGMSCQSRKSGKAISPFCQTGSPLCLVASYACRGVHSFFKLPNEIVLRKACECVPTYLPIFVCPYKLTHVSSFLSGKYSLYTRDKGPINPTISYCTSKLWFEGGFLIPSQKAGVATQYRHRVWLS